MFFGIAGAGIALSAVGAVFVESDKRFSPEYCSEGAGKSLNVSVPWEVMLANTRSFLGNKF